MIHEGELIFRSQDGQGEAEEGMIGEVQEQEESEQAVQEENVEAGTELKTHEQDAEEEKEQKMECESQT